MAPTVGDLRNEIRTAVDRFERRDSPAFTKEDLAAICTAVGHEVDDAGRLPPKAEMRAAALRSIDRPPEDGDALDRPFRKAELEALLAALGAE